jgi:hypothetical protein
VLPFLARPDGNNNNTELSRCRRSGRPACVTWFILTHARSALFLFYALPLRWRWRSRSEHLNQAGLRVRSMARPLHAAADGFCALRLRQSR